MKKIDCDKLKIYHAWEDITPSIVMATFPPQYPPKTEKCKNCGKVRRLLTKQREIKEWEIYD